VNEPQADRESAATEATASPPRRRISISLETLLALCAVYFVVVLNGPFWRALLAGRAFSAATVFFVSAVGIALIALTFVLLNLLVWRPFARVLLTFLFLGSAAAVYFMANFGVVLDDDMLRNLFHTDYREAKEFAGVKLLSTLIGYSIVPVAFVWWVRFRKQAWSRTAIVRLSGIAGGLLLAVLSLLLVYQDFASVMRNKHEMRYLLVPGNFLTSSVRALSADTRTAARPKEPIALDAKAPAVHRSRPLLFMLVVGETVRADHFGLNGYERQTTPELAQLDVVNFSDVASCGTSTEVSLPCMFSRWGRANYNERRIRSEQSVLNVLARVGVNVLWRDNQAGCKGVCVGDGIRFDSFLGASIPGLCQDGRCYDDVLLHDLRERLAANAGASLVVLHQLGNHGPAYFSRYPPEFRRFTPTCDTAELRECSREAIVNTYDNAILYTDHVLAQAIDLLQGLSDRFDTALLYVSDHGESLGDHGLYLHGMPYAIAPHEQTHVPMIIWMSPQFADSLGVSASCMRERAQQPASHDNLFHTLLGVFGVQTSEYDAGKDLFAGCEGPVKSKTSHTEITEHTELE
jgi:lipid A ethanolaminephosphotransferase